MFKSLVEQKLEMIFKYKNNFLIAYVSWSAVSALNLEVSFKYSKYEYTKRLGSLTVR